MTNETKEQDKPKKTTAAQRLRQINTKKAIKGTTLLIGLVLIVFMTITDIVFDPEKFNFFTWLSKTMILVGISTFGLLMGESIGRDKLQELVEGLYQTSLTAYAGIRKTITPYYNYFGQYYTKFIAKELREKKIHFLVANGFDGDEAEILADNINERDIPDLIKGPIKRTNKHGKTIGICQINEDQEQIMKDMVAITLDAPDFAYFLSANATSNQKGIAEKGKEIPRERKFSKHFNRIWKLTFTMVITAAWSILTVQDFMNGNNTQAWVNLISRLTALASSFTSGWGSAIIDSKLASEELDNKTILLTDYDYAIMNKEFIPEDYEARFAREDKEAEERKKAQEEAMKLAAESVITPEKVDMPKMIGGSNND